jgi:hypothetical protein
VAALIPSPPRRRNEPPLSCDRRDHVFAGGVARLERAARAAEEQHEDPVGDLEHVGEVVTDHDHPEPPLAQSLDQGEHLRGLGDAQCRGGLVEQHHLRLAEQRPGDGDLLALPSREVPDLAADVRDGDCELLEQLV